MYTSFIFLGVRGVGELSDPVVEFSSIGNDSSILVDLTPCRCRFMCPLSVAGDASGKYFWTDDIVSPGHVANWLLSIALSSVRFGGLNRHWCKNFTKASLDVRA